ncbi:MAG: enoyl-CoA hydratase/isomerase family protein [Nisaea sp.]|jgi:enoyl-CoA hydratase/carnithine racemase|uniref:enoyl-CoA hydratase n=1 Tax=Nisaea sp. TaxID=2024842 RepID=UPI001B1EC3D7|nr:enoyl-CoA hydratase [Nisaea sp.]MBO6561964.1 enoyl-CoA hydratase/isomerase family protein [Nisaea sp.]
MSDTPETIIDADLAAGAGDDILYEVRDGIGFLTFNRPEKRNSMTFEMYERMAQICVEVSEKRDIRALVLTGAGDKAFAAGTDMSQFRVFDKEEDALGYEARIDRVLGALERCKVPTIAAIRGACAGGGAGIAACCDLRIAARSSKFGFPIARTLGNCLSMMNFARLADLIGSARAKELIFLAKMIEAPKALEYGFISEVVDAPEDVLPRAEEIAREVATYAPLTLLAAKVTLRRLRTELPPGGGKDMMLMCYMSEDFREGMDAFLTKRSPVFKGK